MPEKNSEKKLAGGRTPTQWALGGLTLGVTGFSAYMEFRHGLSYRYTTSLVAGATGALFTKRQWFNSPDFERNVRIGTAENQGTTKFLAGSTCVVFSAMCVATFLPSNGDTAHEKSSVTTTVAAKVGGVAAPQVSGVLDANTIAALNLGEGSGCDIAPYILDEKDVKTPEDRYRKNMSVVLLKEYLAQKIDPKTNLPFFQGNMNATAGKDLTHSVDGLQELLGINKALPWNGDTCGASELGDADKSFPALLIPVIPS